MDLLLQDVRYGLRVLAKSPGFAAVALATLLLGIGANIAMFTFVDAALLRPLPFRQPSRLMQVFETRHTDVWSTIEASYPDYRDWRAQQQVFTEIGAWNGPGDAALRTDSGPQRVAVTRVSDSFFRVLEVKPMLGRDFREGEEAASGAPVAILSYRTWRERYGANPHIVGQTITIMDTAVEVIGVLPREFRYAPVGEPEYWLPLRPRGGSLERRNLHWINVVGRLKPGVSREQANDAMNVIMKRLAQQYPIAQGVESVSVQPLIDVVVGQIRPVLLVLLAGVGLLLLIACANVANLLLARSSARQREIAIRASLGATRWRIIRQLMTEGALLAVTGAFGGLLLARWMTWTLAARVPEELRMSMSFFSDLRIDATVVLFSCGVAALTSVLFALAPAMQMAGADVQESLKEGARSSQGRGWGRFSRALVVGELAIAIVLLAGAGLLIKSFYSLLRSDIGLQPDHLLLVHVATPRAFNDEQTLAFAREMLAKVSAIPGVQAVGTSSVEPLNGGNTIRFRHLDESAREGEEANIRDITPGYFKTMGTRWVSGRDFTEQDDAKSPQVLIVNQTFVRLFFKGADPVGKQIVFTFKPTEKPRTIIGVVGDLKEAQLDAEPRPAIYAPFFANGDLDMLAVRTGTAPESLMKSVEDTIHSINPNVMTYDAKTGETLVNGSPAAYLHRYPAWLAGAFAAFALSLAVIGLYGIVAYSVSQRTREIGIRIALGAQPGTVRTMVLRESAVMTSLGLAVGLIAAAAAARLLRSVLFGVSPWDPGLLAMVGLLCAVVATLAAYLPARRASMVDPMVALRYE